MKRLCSKRNGKKIKKPITIKEIKAKKHLKLVMSKKSKSQQQVQVEVDRMRKKAA
ncbi:MAG: hypothetical protein ISR65_14195 [Bacteriovoracaceae bacterium]|nr:hypothetical protein [Bacteriovoracaceae bacterium]